MHLAAACLALLLAALGARQDALYLPMAAPKDDARFLLDDAQSQESILFAVFPQAGGVGWGGVLDAAHPAPLAPASALLDALASAHRTR